MQQNRKKSSPILCSLAIPRKTTFLDSSPRCPEDGTCKLLETVDLNLEFASFQSWLIRLDNGATVCQDSSRSLGWTFLLFSQIRISNDMRNSFSSSPEYRFVAPSSSALKYSVLPKEILRIWNPYGNYDPVVFTPGDVNWIYTKASIMRMTQTEQQDKYVLTWPSHCDQ